MAKPAPFVRRLVRRCRCWLALRLVPEYAMYAEPSSRVAARYTLDLLRIIERKPVDTETVAVLERLAGTSLEPTPSSLPKLRTPDGLPPGWYALIAPDGVPEIGKRTPEQHHVDGCPAIQRNEPMLCTCLSYGMRNG